MIKFKDDDSLGKTVDRMKAMCFGFEPIQNMLDMRLYGGGHKFSRLCAFKFHSALPKHAKPNFSIAFVAKLRSKIYRKQTENPSQWYIFKSISPTQIDVLGKKELLLNYGFDIDKFFQSDVFKAFVGKFKQLIKKGLDVEIPAFLEKVKSGQVKAEPDAEREIKRYEEAIRESLALIDKPIVNDKYYQLFIGTLREDEDASLDEKINQAMDEIYGEEISEGDLKEERTPEDFKCKVTKVKEDGHDAWEVSEIATGRWVATFEDEALAKKFAEEEYPKLKADYINQQAKMVQ